VSPFQPGLALEVGAVDAGVSHDKPRGQLDHRLLAERDRLADGDHVVELVLGLLLGEDTRVEHHEVLVAEELDEPVPVGLAGRAHQEAGGCYSIQIRASHRSSRRPSCRISARRPRKHFEERDAERKAAASFLRYASHECNLCYRVKSNPAARPPCAAGSVPSTAL
jgi:hypothetical protein